MTETRTRSQLAAADVAALLRARNPLLWVVTREEARVERYLIEAAGKAGYIARTWDVAQGIAEIGDKPSVAFRDTQDAAAALSAIKDRATASDKTQRGAFIMRDLPVWLGGMPGAQTNRMVRNLARLLPTVPRERAQALIVLSPSNDVPPELQGHATVIDWPLPDRDEIAAILDASIAGLPDEIREAAAPNGTRDKAIDAAVGLTGEEAANCYAKSLVQTKRIDPVTVAQEKRRVVAKSGLLEWFDPLPGGLDAVGGLDGLKSWLLSRSSAYSPAARAYGLPAPKGVLLVGVSGCGKSLSAKAIATAWGVPLFRLDLGALKSKYVGESEGNLRKAFAVIAAVGRCVVWLDEIEKALAGATQGAADGGVSSDAMGAILTWMQERQGEAFVIATANDVSQLPPEFIRKGRWDEVFFVDLPNHPERVEITRAAIRANGRDPAGMALNVVATHTEGFTGAEVAALVPDALYVAFADNAREIEANDLIEAARNVVPLSITAAEKINALRSWAKTRARAATTGGKPAAVGTGERQIDL